MIVPAGLEPRLRLAIVGTIQAGELIDGLGIEDTYGVDELRAYLGAVESNLGEALDLLRIEPALHREAA